MTTTTVRGAIFDIDGTLLDSNDAHARSWVDVLREAGHDVSFETIRPMIGMGGDRILAEVVGVDDESDEGERLTDARRAIFLERYLPHLRPCPGARELLLRLKEAGVRLVVGTSADGQELSGLLERAGVPDVFEDETTSSDVETSKPAPDIVEAALQKLGLPREEVLFVGDTPYDVEAGARAGVRTVAVRTGGWSDEDLAGAVAIYDDPVDLVLHLESSPFGVAPEQRPSL